ncbi:homoserine dehydrogenase [Evansella sp. AB-P1]|uniref:homoserine dehydrogenase n=1 Tax=Evansella sp. AB-P1 TaxID=3037653 RepID=UPI00241DC0C7|nr:homoserine dehydrogenase [Evansella sp. AB-P1]MDG5788944.1 homoserine dehydrogenase [Evansella sp. AB-P1]
MSQSSYKIAIIGFGTVGEGVYKTIMKYEKKIEALLGRSLEIPLVLVKNQYKNRNVRKGTMITDEFDKLFQHDSLHAVVEASPDAETSYPYVVQLLNKGISVISANKELIANHGRELHNIAAKNKCILLYEAAVAGGIPLLNTLRHTLKTNTIKRLDAIVNGTSNFMLTKMREASVSFEDALEEAQRKGYAEAVPDKDVDGWDAYFKTKIMTQWIYGCESTWTSEKPIGIRGVDTEDIMLAKQFHARIKHVATINKNGSNVESSVRPCLVFEDHPLFNVEGVNNAIQIEGSIVGSIVLQGPGAGEFPTASAIIEDLVNLLTGRHEPEKQVGIEFLHEQSHETLVGKTSEENEELNDGKEAGLWFVTSEKDVSNFLVTTGATVVKSILEIGKKYGTLIYSSNECIKEITSQLEKSDHVYPVLLGESSNWTNELKENLSVLV